MPGIGNKINLNAGTKVSILTEIKQAYNKATIVEKLIYINIFLFLITVLFNKYIITWFAVPTDFSSFVSKPWTIFTYSFVHERFIHLLSNLLILYFVGNLFLDFYSKKLLINFYFLGAFTGALCFLTYYYLTEKTAPPLGGASAAVTAVFAGIATKIPRYALRLRFIGSVELWVLAAIWVGLSALQLAGIYKGAAISHLAGAGFGFIYAKQLDAGNDIGRWFESIIDYFSNLFKPRRSTMKTVHRSKRRTTKNEVTKSKQRKIDDILDKIGKSGYESLSQEEKDFLFRAGKK